MTDNEILAHLKQEKYSAALKGLYNFLPDVKRYIKANSGTADDALDIFQDALLVLCNKINAGDFVLTAPLKAYLLAVVRNCWLQELRQRKKLPAGEALTEKTSYEFNEEPQFMLAEAAFKSLGEKCRQLLTLFYYSKKTYEEIAGLLAFSEARIAKNQKYRCLQKAKEHYLTLTKTSPHE